MEPIVIQTYPSLRAIREDRVRDLEEQYLEIAQKQIEAHAEYERLKGEMTALFWELSAAKTKLKEITND